MHIHIEIDGNIRSMPRPKFTVTKKGKVITYIDTKYRKWLKELRNKIENQIDDNYKHILPADKNKYVVGVNAVFYVKRDKDIDNMLKSVLDAMQGIIYENDIQVYGIHALKYKIKCGTEKMVIDVIINSKYVGGK